MTFPLDNLIRDVATSTDAPDAVPVWYEAQTMLPYVDLQYGSQLDPRQQIKDICTVYSEHVHTLWARTSAANGYTDELHVVGTQAHQTRFPLRYRFDRVRVEWTDPSGEPRGVTQQRLRHPGIYRANNSRIPTEAAPTCYGTRTTPSYGRDVTPQQLFEQFDAAPAVLQGETARPHNTRRVVLSYKRHLVRVLLTVRTDDAPPYWHDFTLDDWDNIDNTPWPSYHKHYCGLE